MAQSNEQGGDELHQEILMEWLVHDETCAYSVSYNPCDCIQANVAKNIMPLIEAYRKQHELEARIDELEALEPILNYMGDQVKLNKRINELKSERERLGK